jgi:hypothetical protein
MYNVMINFKYVERDYHGSSFYEKTHSNNKELQSVRYILAEIETEIGNSSAKHRDA